MNRRNFIKGAIQALAGFTILPGAGRIWRAETKIIPAVNPTLYQGEWVWCEDGARLLDEAGEPVRRVAFDLALNK